MKTNRYFGRSLSDEDIQKQADAAIARNMSYVNTSQEKQKRPGIKTAGTAEKYPGIKTAGGCYPLARNF